MATSVMKRGKRVWLGQIKRTICGEKIRKQKQFSTRKAAVAWETAMAIALEQQSSAGLTSTDFFKPEATLFGWSEEYLDHCVRFAQKTQDEKVVCFRRMFKATDANGKKLLYPDMPPRSISVGVALKVMDSIFAKHGGGVANKIRKNLVAWWNYQMKIHQEYTTNPWVKVAKFPADQTVPPYTPPEKDFWKVVDSLTDPQDKAMILTYFYTAARRSELFRLDVEHIDFNRSTITLFSRKNRQGQLVGKTLPMVATLREVLSEHLAGKTSGPVFVSEQTGERFVVRQYWIRKASEKAGVKPFGYHGIRRLAASVLADRNVPMVSIQHVLRHENLATTERYVRGLADLGGSMSKLEGSYAYATKIQ